MDYKIMLSREIAELTGKNHQHVLRDCDTLNEYYEKMSLSKIGQSSYKADNGHTYRELLLSRMQTFDLIIVRRGSNGKYGAITIQYSKTREELPQK